MANKVLMKGNEALAEAAMRCGCRFFFGYPITPQTELAAYMAKKMEKNGDISEDDLKDGNDKIQKLTDKMIDKIDKAVETKTKEIMTV